MKRLIRLNLVFVLTFLCLSSFGQANCKVLKPEISKSYTGKCKNGLASGSGVAEGIDRYEGQFIKGLPDGEGTYSWSTGEIYKGEWKEGKRHGEGDYTFFYNGRDSTFSGIWQSDTFIGVVPGKPNIIYKSGIDRYSVTKTGTVKNRVLIDIFQNGARNTSISNFMTSSSSGYESSIGLSNGYDEVVFPVRLKVTYTTQNKLKTASYYVEFEVEIFEPGDWKIVLHN